MIALEPHRQGVVLPVRAHAGARSSAIRGMHEGALKVSVTQVAEKGKANRAIRDVLCKQLGLRKSQVELISGTTSSQKKFLVRETSVDDLLGRIEAVLG